MWDFEDSKEHFGDIQWVNMQVLSYSTVTMLLATILLSYANKKFTFITVQFFFYNMFFQYHYDQGNINSF